MALPVTIITGASSGIGAATAHLLAQRGHAVALLSRDEAALREVAAALPDGTTFLVRPCDVTVPEQVADAVGAVVDELGTPFGLVNAAGVCVPGPLPQTTAEDW